MSTAGDSITQLLINWSNGDHAALDRLTPYVQQELRVIARKYFRRPDRYQTLQPTALINELYLKLIDQSQPVKWENRSHFFGIAARMMRHILVDHARVRGAVKRGGDQRRITLGDAVALNPEIHEPEIMDLDDALNRLARFDARKAAIIELRYFGGMNREEIACASGLTLATVKRDLRLGEAWLRRDLTGHRKALT